MEKILNLFNQFILSSKFLPYPFILISFSTFFSLSCLYLSGASHSQINKSKELCKSVLQVQKIMEKEENNIKTKEIKLNKIKKKMCSWKEKNADKSETRQF